MLRTCSTPPSRSSQTQLLTDLLSDRAHHQVSCRYAGLVLGHIEIGFVRRRGSIRSVCCLKISRTLREPSRWRGKSGATKIAAGHRRCACTADIAECNPKCRASYEAAQTTERLLFQATMTGLPRSCGYPVAPRKRKTRPCRHIRFCAQIVWRCSLASFPVGPLNRMGSHVSPHGLSDCAKERSFAEPSEEAEALQLVFDWILHLRKI